jgi:hypothetical protein
MKDLVSLGVEDRVYTIGSPNRNILSSITIQVWVSWYAYV